MEKTELIINKVKDIEKGTVKVLENVDFKDIDWMLYEYVQENDVNFQEELFQKDNDYVIWMNKGYTHILELELKIHDIIYCNRIEESEEYEEEFSGWIFFNDKTDKVIYEEGYSNLGAAIWNRFHKKTENLKCDVYI